MNNLINSLKKEKKEKQDYILRLEKVAKEFPDIREYGGRWSKWLCSKLVNKVADQIDFNYSCGCCPDASLYAMPYIEHEGFKIYSDPARIWIGQQVFYGGDEANENWREELEKHNINAIIYPLIEQYFEENPPGKVVYEEN